MKKVTILRFLTAVGAALTTLASLDLTGIAEIFDDQVALYLLATGPAALSLKELVVSVGDWLDDGKLNKSFKIGLLCLLLCLIPLPFLASCAPQQVSGGVVTEDGRFTLRPDGRIEIVIEPRTSK